MNNNTSKPVRDNKIDIKDIENMNNLSSCECGWTGYVTDLIYKSDYGENWAVDQHSCPKCGMVIIDNLS